MVIRCRTLHNAFIIMEGQRSNISNIYIYSPPFFLLLYNCTLLLHVPTENKTRNLCSFLTDFMIISCTVNKKFTGPSCRR